MKWRKGQRFRWPQDDLEVRTIVHYGPSCVVYRFSDGVEAHADQPHFDENAIPL